MDPLAEDTLSTQPQSRPTLQPPAAAESDPSAPSRARSKSPFVRQWAIRMGNSVLNALGVLSSLIFLVLRATLLSWGLFELVKWALPTPWFMAAHAVLVIGAIAMVGGVIGVLLCLPWALLLGVLAWSAPLERLEGAFERFGEWVLFVLGWGVFMAPWAFSAWVLAAPWKGHWAQLAMSLAKALKI